ncbi:MAG TPA: sialidase family protein [Vicinamibacteria bacterium]|nr:sialidase family protein [Vicinamibacteria bacterium]
MIARRGALAGLVLLAACGGAARQEPAAAVEPGRVRELATPAAPGSGEPNLAAGPDGSTYLSWIEPLPDSTHALRFAVRAAGGEWTEPRTIARGKGWFVNWADFPALLAFGDGALAAHWLQRNGTGTYAYEVRVALSRDGGDTWSEGAVPHRDGTPTEHGFVSLVPWDAGRAGLVWLDGRHTGGHGGHEGAASAAMALMHTTLGADGSLGPEVVLDARVCDCCQTSAARAKGALVVAYRDRSGSEVRDIATVRYADGRWSAPALVAADGWVINGCPVNGPAVAADEARVAVAWFSAPEEKGRVLVAFSSDSGGSYGAPVRVDDGRPIGRVDVVLLPGGDALVSWLEQVAPGAEVRVRTASPSGRRGPALTVAASSEARSSGFPRLERAGGEVVLAWRDAAEPPRVRTATIELR